MELQIVSVKLPVKDVRRIPGVRSRFIRDAVAEKLAREEAPTWYPRSDGGILRRELRKRLVKSGADLLDAEGIAREIRERRGGLA